MSKLAYFNKKSQAIEYWNKTENTYLFQLDKKEGQTGSKQFIIGNLDQIWTLIKSGNNHIYESWEDKPVHFGLDIDYPSQDVLYKDVILHIKQIISGILLAVNQQDFKLNVEDVIVLENENQGLSPVSKYSFHIIFRGLVMENCSTSAKLFDNLEGINLEGCDKSIYRKTCFRTCFSSKLDKKIVMVPLVLKIGNKETDNENNYESLKEFWKSTLLCNIKDYQITYYEKDEDNALDNFKPTDVITKELTQSELSNIENVLMQLPDKYFNDYYFWSKIGMILRNLNADPNLLLEIFKKFSARSLTKYKGVNDILKYWKTFKNTRKNKIGLGSLFLWCKEEKISFTDNKGLDTIISEYPERKLEVNYDYTEIDQRYFPISEIENAWSKKLIGIQSEKGTGKTTSLFKYLFNSISNKSDFDKNDSVLFISSRRTFGIKLLGDIEKHGFKLYSECKDYYIDHDKMICQIDSILRLTNEKFKYVIIDECESLMRYLTSSHFTKNNKSSLIVSNFETKIMEAEKVIIMDADLCDRSITYYKNIASVESNEMKIILNKFQPYNDYIIQYMAYSTWLKVLMNKLDNKKKIVIPTASNNQAKDLKLLIEAHHPNIKILLIHRETSENEKLDQVINVNTKWNKYSVIIYTPSVCMGISFDDEYFDHIFAYGCENSLGSQEFCQMLHRVRKPKEKSIYLALDKYSEYDKIRHEVNISKIEEIICYDYYLTHFNLHNNMIPKKFKPNTNKDSLLKLIDGSGGNIVILKDDEQNDNSEDIYIEEKKFVYPYKEESIYSVYLKNAQELILDRLNFANQLFGYFKMKGYKLLKHDWEDGEMIKNEIKEIRELRKEEELNKDIDGIFGASDITDDQYKELIAKRKEELSQDDIYKLHKRNFKKCYILDSFNKELLTKYKDITVMKYYHNLSVILPDEQNTVEKRLEDIREERINNTYINNAYSDLTIKNSYTKHKWAIQIIKALGFNLSDLEIRLTTATIEDILSDNDIISDIDSKIEYFIHKFNIAFPKKKLSEMDTKDKLKFISKIIESQYGLTITKDSAKNYYLSDNNKWDELYEFRNNKSASGIKLNEKIIKKEKANINIDQSWFEE